MLSAMVMALTNFIFWFIEYELVPRRRKNKLSLLFLSVAITTGTYVRLSLMKGKLAILRAKKYLAQPKTSLAI